jgi:hypothetical protein
MTNRTIRICGWGTGQSPATITAWVDGEQVFSGSVNLIELDDSNQGEYTAPTLFTFEVPMDFVGTKRMRVAVTDATVRFAYVQANYVNTDGCSTGPDGFTDASQWIDGVKDARKNVIIDGRPQSVDRTMGYWAWHWFVEPGSTIAHDIVISAALQETEQVFQVLPDSNQDG